MAFESFYDFFKQSANQCQTAFIISDTHFNDDDLKKIPGRSDAEEMLKKINGRIGSQDFLIHLGDVGDLSYARRLKGKVKWLIAGNHDSGITTYQRHKYYEKFDAEKYTKEQAIAEMKAKYPNCSYRVQEIYNTQFEPFKIWYVEADNNLFDFVFSGPLMIAEKLILSHEPVDVPWAFNIHGHTHHRSYKNDKRHFCACADHLDFYPMNFNQFMKSGKLAHIETIHRETIDKATIRKAKRGGKKIGEK